MDCVTDNGSNARQCFVTQAFLLYQLFKKTSGLGYINKIRMMNYNKLYAHALNSLFIFIPVNKKKQGCRMFINGYCTQKTHFILPRAKLHTAH